MCKLKLSAGTWKFRDASRKPIGLAEAQRLLGAGDARRRESLPKKAEVAHPRRMADASWELLHIMSH